MHKENIVSFSRICFLSKSKLILQLLPHLVQRLPLNYHLEFLMARSDNEKIDSFIFDNYREAAKNAKTVKKLNTNRKKYGLGIKYR